MDIAPFLAASATVTKVVDFTRNLIDKQGTLPKWLWNFTAFGYATLLAWTAHLNVLPANKAWYGTVLAGLAIGASSSGFHEVFDFFSAKAKGVK